jgi:VanZ family protein
VRRDDAAIQPTGGGAVGSRPASLDGAGVVRWWSPVGVYALAILVGASLPPSSVPGGVSDGTLHAWGYAGFTIVILRAVARGRWSGISAGHALAAVLMATLYGLAMEVYQLFVPARFFDLRDLLADAAGAVAAGSIAVLGTRARRFVFRNDSSSS